MRLIVLSALLAGACSASEPSLPHRDPDASERQQAIDKVAMSIRNENRTHTANNQTFRLNPGPIPYPGSLAESMIIQETVLFQSNENPDTALIFGITESFNISTLEDYDAMYAALESVIEVPLTRRDSSDEAFAQDRLTVKGTRLRALTDEKPLDSRLSMSPNESVCGEKSVEKLRRKNRLFVEDLSFVGEYNDPAASSKYTPSSVGYFCVAKRTGKFVLLAIHLLDTDIMYFPTDSQDEWTLAKMALNAASLNVQQIDHFIENHLMLEPIRVELLRSVSPRHPVYKLLEHHFTQLFGNTPAGLVGLLSGGTTYDKIFGWGATGTLRYLQDELPRANFTRGFEHRMKHDGLQWIPAYRFRDYGIMHWNALVTFLRLYLEPYYPPSAGNPASLRAKVTGNAKHKNSLKSEDLQHDTELQGWASATCSIVEDFPCHFDGLDDVIDTLANLIFRVSVQHHVRNSDGAYHSFSYPFSLPSLNHPLPVAKGVEVDLMDYVLPRSVLGESMALFAFFKRAIGPGVSILHSYDSVDLGELSAPAVLQHRAELNAIEAAIDAREAREDRPFVLMKPSRLPYYVWA